LILTAGLTELYPILQEKETCFVVDVASDELVVGAYEIKAGDHEATVRLLCCPSLHCVSFSVPVSKLPLRHLLV
jgi:hypothetical protein